MIDISSNLEPCQVPDEVNVFQGLGISASPEYSNALKNMNMAFLASVEAVKVAPVESAAVLAESVQPNHLGTCRSSPATCPIF